MTLRWPSTHWQELGERPEMAVVFDQDAWDRLAKRAFSDFGHCLRTQHLQPRQGLQEMGQTAHEEVALRDPEQM